jgi:hypothetical protein
LIQGPVAQAKALEILNQNTDSRYKNGLFLSQSLVLQTNILHDNYVQIQDSIQRLEELEASVTKLERIISEIEQYSIEIRNQG